MQKEWEDCVKRERAEHPDYTDNDILVMKLS